MKCVACFEDLWFCGSNRCFQPPYDYTCARNCNYATYNPSAGQITPPSDVKVANAVCGLVCGDLVELVTVLALNMGKSMTV